MGLAPISVSASHFRPSANFSEFPCSQAHVPARIRNVLWLPTTKSRVTLTMRPVCVTTPLTPHRDLDRGSLASLSAYIQAGARREDTIEGAAIVCDVTVASAQGKWLLRPQASPSNCCRFGPGAARAHRAAAAARPVPLHPRQNRGQGEDGGAADGANDVEGRPGSAHHSADRI